MPLNPDLVTVYQQNGETMANSPTNIQGLSSVQKPALTKDQAIDVIDEEGNLIMHYKKLALTYQPVF